MGYIAVQTRHRFDWSCSFGQGLRSEDPGLKWKDSYRRLTEMASLALIPSTAALVVSTQYSAYAGRRDRGYYPHWDGAGN